MELNSIIHLAESKGLMASIGINLDSRVIAPVDVDLRCVLTWDTDLSDVELIITEPSGEKSNSFHNHSRFGGLLSRNFSRGYGPVEWMIKQAPPGDYSIDVRLYHTPDPIGTVCASVVVMSDFDRPSQSTLGHVSVLLDKTNDTAHVGVIHVAAAP
ncbi:hypothetical protein Pelo_6830 [Pelomyxa schiedti]|nr:hypothetical protein Pelo_6830 [Pelomyxa schiedti]